MPLYDISYSASGERLMTVEATTMTEAAMRAIDAAPHCDGIGRLQGNITVRPHQPPCTVAYFGDGFFHYLADLIRMTDLARNSEQ